MYCTEVRKYFRRFFRTKVRKYESTFVVVLPKYLRTTTVQLRVRVRKYLRNKLLVTKKLINKIVYDMSVWVWAYVQYVVHVQRPTTLYVYNVVVVLYLRTCVVHARVPLYEGTFVLSKVQVRKYFRTFENNTSVQPLLYKYNYNVRRYVYNVVQRTCTEHVRKYCTRTVYTYTYTTVLRNFFLRNFFLNNFYFTVHVQYNVLYSTCTVRVVYVYSCTHTIKLCCTLSTLHVYVVVS